MKLIYVAGPYSAPTEYEVQLNIAKAEAAALEIWKTTRAAAICPHKNTAHWGGALTHDEFIAGDLEMIRRCDAVFLLDGWERSKGAREEYNFAMEHGIFVFYNLEVLVEWIDNDILGPMESHIREAVAV
jgi:hypothetical protein